MTANSDRITLFQDRGIRHLWHEDEWYFSVIDAIGALTDCAAPGAYWRKLKQRLNQEGSQVVKFCHGLKLAAADGKCYKTDCANAKSSFSANIKISFNKNEFNF